MSLEAEILRETKLEFIRSNHVVRACQLVGFVSRSKGRGRSRPTPAWIELLRYGSRCYQLKDDWCPGLDGIAREVTGNDDVPEFLGQLRALARM